jgi:hypothetical protein
MPASRKTRVFSKARPRSQVGARSAKHHEAALRFFMLFAFYLLLVRATFVQASELQGPTEGQRLILNSTSTRSFTHAGRPGDPLNIAVVGSEDELLRIMAAALWDPADPITVKSSLRIAVDSVVRKPYIDAPVSNLYVNGKKQDLAFEQPAANNPSKRHHVRFWRMDPPNRLDRPLWIGAATYDASIGLSHVNGHITHHIAPDVDSERDKLVGDIQRVGMVAIRWIDNFQTLRQGRNGGGDLFYTDGRLAVIVVDAPR